MTHYWQQISQITALSLSFLCLPTTSCGGSGYGMKMVQSTLGVCDFVLDQNMDVRVYFLFMMGQWSTSAYVCL